MRPGRRESEHHVAGADGAAVDDAALLHHADGKAREVVFAVGVHAGHLRRLSPDERAACLLATQSDALDHGGRRVDVEPAAGEVIEEEQRLRTLDEDVVHAHRDEVDADGVVARELECELELRADAVGAGDEHRLAKTLADLHESAEAADAGEDFGTHRALRVRLDALDQRIARVDVDACIAIGEARRHGGWHGEARGEKTGELSFVPSAR